VASEAANCAPNRPVLQARHLGEEVPAELDLSALTQLSLIPRALVVKLGFVDKLRSDISGGGREAALQRGKEAAKEKEANTAKSKRKKQKKKTDCVLPEDWHVRAGKRTSTGKFHKSLVENRARKSSNLGKYRLLQDQASPPRTK
jgi:hypothetical protein